MANSHSRKGDVDNVGQLGLVGARRGVAEEDHVVDLGQGVDHDGDVGALHVVVVLALAGGVKFWDGGRGRGIG